MDNMFKMGPSEMQGEIWDEKGFSKIVDILVSHQQDCINSIKFTYDFNREIVHSQTHGQPNGLKFDMVEFDYHSEWLTSLSGEYKNGRLASITFGTNKKTYGPFGRTGSRSSSSGLYDEFEYKFNPLRFGGLHGSVCDGSVYAIGVYVKPYKIYTLEEYCDELLESLDDLNL
ncbi:hypothetical protein R6Q59_003198 [Mikania micrantha]|uniref:Jacalin-type lectin domain-containing protein n=1 Tax=Mikania micrantha TaxID=192012 RepID=A0A5N6MJ98_9ASTR|nr:hypothetical protein E3N88_29594 [Mikania micrantha]